MLIKFRYANTTFYSRIHFFVLLIILSLFVTLIQNYSNCLCKQCRDIVLDCLSKHILIFFIIFILLYCKTDISMQLIGSIFNTYKLS